MKRIAQYTTRRFCLSCGRARRLEPPCQLTDSDATMRDPQLLFRTDFCQRHAVLGIVEDRVVTEPTRSTRRVDNLALDDPRCLECDDSIMHDGDGAHEASRSLDSWC